MKYTTYIIAIVLMLSPLFTKAQDGEGLFKSKCNVCHMVDKGSTGPWLKGVKAKWAEAGEAENLYEWVKNPAGLVASGKSPQAKIAVKMEAGSMTPQDLSNEEIDAVLDYVDNYVKPEEKAGTVVSADGKMVTIVANYDENLTLFYALLATTLILLFAIIVMSGTMIRFIKSDYFKEKSKESGNNTMFKTIILLIGFTVVSSSNTYALNFMEPGEAAEGSPWLLVENIDIYVLLTINFILVGVLFYIRRMMNVFMNMTKPEVEVEETEPEVLKKMNKILTDVVPIEEEHTILMHHEYDGIKELDNNLPPWWVWMFYGTIIFAVIYIFNYHVLGTGDLQIAEYDKSVTKAEKEIEAYRTANAMNVDESNVTLMTEGSDLSKGKSIFADKCVTCHLDKGQGEIGPNLTDDTWIYGYDIAKVFGTIKNGTPNGMPDHKSKLNPIEIQQVASFVISMPEVDGKEPQGDIIEQ